VVNGSYQVDRSTNREALLLIFSSIFFIIYFGFFCKEVAMLKLTLTPDEYILINDNIVLKLTEVVGGRVHLAMEAPREVPIVRGAVLEREGGSRPACLTHMQGKV
jgi:carbon storage regulator CsrA